MFVKRRIEIKKEFENKETAMAFASGIEFAGSRDIMIKDIVEEGDKHIVILEKLEKSKV